MQSRISLFGAVAAAAALAVLPPPVNAQQSPVLQGDSPASPTLKAKRNVATTNPFGLLFEFYQAEYERSVGTQITLGISGSHYAYDEEYGDFGGGSSREETGLSSVDLKVRFYPGDALRGFSIGLAGGMTSVKDRYISDVDPTRDESYTAASVSVLLDYNWLLGRNDNFVVTLGTGAKRLFSSKFDDDDIEGYPIVRAAVGFAW